MLLMLLLFVVVVIVVDVCCCLLLLLLLLLPVLLHLKIGLVWSYQTNRAYKSQCVNKPSSSKPKIGRNGSMNFVFGAFILNITR